VSRGATVAEIRRDHGPDARAGPDGAACARRDAAGMLKQLNSGEGLLLVMGGAMFAVTVAICVLIAAPSGMWLGVAYGAMLLVSVLVGLYLLQFLNTTDDD
jgi:hypothetical protein